MRYFVEIHFPGSGTERHEIIGPEARIGGAPSANIRPEHVALLEPELLQLVPSDEGCQVSLAPGQPIPLMFMGAPHWQVVVPWGEEVFVKGARYTFLRKAGSAQRPSPILLGAAALLLPLGGLWAYSAGGERDVSRLELEPPALSVPAATCAAQAPAEAEARAERGERAALAKEERAAFDAADGASALALFGEAAACYSAAGKADEATRVQGELTRWTSQLNEDYAATRLRLKLALEHQRFSEAQGAVAHLQALVPKGPYADWLAALHQELERKASPH